MGQLQQTAGTTLPTSLGGLSRLPIVRQLLLLVGLAAAIAGGIMVFNWSQQPGYVLLFSDLAGKDSAAAAEALRTADIPYKLDAASGALTVPGERVHEARMQLAALGLPKGGASGFEMMQDEPGFGVSSFMEGARYNHALETELSRSIAGLTPVKAARVHLALPKASAFARPGDGPSASVLVDLHAGRSLEPTQVQAIVHMVASSVPNLQPARVTVIDQFGRLLSRDGDDEMAVSGEQFDHARRVEADLARRIEQLLAPITGAGRVSTQVSAELDFSVTEEARESYSPDKTVVRSEQSSEQTSSGAGTALGVPGATSNQPPQAQPAQALNQLGAAPGGASATNQSKNLTRNFEVDRTLSHTRQAAGRLKKISIAVLIDDIARPDGQGGVKLQPLGEAELKKIEGLVRNAVGFDEARGDRVSVQNLSFLTAAPIETAVLPVWQQPQVQTLARHAFGLLAVLVLIFAALRPALKVLLAPTPPPALPQLGGVLVRDDDGQPGGGGRAGTDDGPPVIAPYELKLTAARTAVAQDPKRVAQVVKGWLSEEGAG